MRDIEIRLLRCFVVLAEQQHFASAAFRLGITPRTLMRRIKKLESGLGGKLVERTGDSNVVVTAAGERVLALSREVLRQLEEAARIVDEAERGVVGRVTFGFVPGVCLAGLLQTWIGEFHRTHPEIDINMRALDPAAQIAGIRREELDAGFTRTPHSYPAGFQGIEVYRQRLLLALPGEHPLAGRQDISPEMLWDETFIDMAPEPDVEFFGYAEAVGAIGDFEPRVAKHDHDIGTVLIYVALGHGIAVVPQLLKKMNFDNVVFRGIAADPVPQTSLAFVYRHDASPCAQRLIEHMQRHALPQHGPGGFPRLHVVTNETDST
jgi:DNA-binding transcriptional LysR family regulator